MRNALNTFNRNMDSIKTLHAIHEQFVKIYTALDLSEILRAEYVLIVSAFDCFLHDIVQNYMHHITFEIDDTALIPNEYRKFKMPLDTLKSILEASDETKKQILHAALKKSLSEFSFESSKTVESAMSYIGVNKVWTKIAGLLGGGAEDIKKQLDMIIFRRNCIAHQADIANYTDESKQLIEREDVDEVINFIERITNIINTLVVAKYT
jgi:hypothetical protein